MADGVFADGDTDCRRGGKHGRDGCYGNAQAVRHGFFLSFTTLRRVVVDVFLNAVRSAGCCWKYAL